MNSPLDEAHAAIQRARQALRDRQRGEARRWAERAAALAPQLEDPWLILAAVAGPQAGREYIRRALAIHPESRRAHQALEWALERQHPGPGRGGPATRPEAERLAPRRSHTAFYAVLLLGLGFLVCLMAAWSAVTFPAFASLISPTAALPPRSRVWAPLSIPKPTYTPLPPAEMATATAMERPEASAASQRDEGPATADPAPLLDPQGMALATPETAASPGEGPIPTQTEAIEPLPTETPPAEPTWSGSISLEYVPDTPTAERPAYVAPPAPSYASTGGERWIDVNLSQQMAYAYEGDTIVNSFLVSTGTWLHPTVTGKYRIYVKLRYTDMAGPDYYLPNVPYVMYFYKGYGLHGTYWHNNFGTPMSHGCVNLSIPDAAWLYSWASVGTLVNVHY